MQHLSAIRSSTVAAHLRRAKQSAFNLSLTVLIAWPGLLPADVVVDTSAAAQNRPTLDATASGIPLVQITAPTAGGVSRNQYQTYNVDPQGLILNNARVIAPTQLGGYVEGNPNLAGGSARIILNEVTSTNPSLLRGYTEIAGQRAELVLTNPNGITCNGCGFINTSRSLLTTGTLVFGVDGGLTALRVTGGRIGIEGTGLDASSTSQVDLLARAVSVNAEVWATAINVITGANEIRYDTLGVAPLSPDAHRPGLALDVGTLGGMYANRIRLIGTETGVGVRSAGTLAANAGDFSLTNQGQIVLTGQTVASGQVSITTPDRLVHQGTILAGADTTLAAAMAVDNSGGNIGAGRNLTLTTATMNNTGGKFAASSDIILNAQNFNGAGVMTAGRDLNVSLLGDVGLGSGDVWSANRKLILATAGNIVNAGELNGATLTTTSDQFTNSGTVVGNTLTINANSILNQGASALVGATGDINLNVANTLTNRDSATIYSVGDITIAGSSARDAAGMPVDRTGSILNESARIEAEKNLTLWAGRLTNKKRLLAVTANNVVIGVPTQHTIGNLTYTETVTEDRVTADSPAAQLLAGGDNTINVTSTIDNEYSVITAGGKLEFLATKPTNLSAALYRTTTQSGSETRYTPFKRCRSGGGSTCIGAYIDYIPYQVPYNPSPTAVEYDRVPAFFTGGTRIVGKAVEMNNIVLNPNLSAVNGITASLSGNPNLSLTPTGLFQLTGSPDAAYLIQTNPRFTDFATFMSSDYMMRRLGINFADNAKRLGDGFYEQKLVQEQVLQLTGRRFLAGYGSNETQFQALMDAGVSVAERLELVPGIALTANQTAALTSDIVWLEQRDVAGRKVLVPIVYLSSVHKNDLDGFGPLMAAEDIDLKLVGDLANGGTIKAARMLRVDAANVVNRGGTLAAGDKMYLIASNDLINQSGTIKGGDLSLTAGRDFRHETVFEYIDVPVGRQPASFSRLKSTSSGSGQASLQTTRVGAQGNIDATGRLNVEAGHDLSVTAATVRAGSDVTLVAGHKLTLNSAEKRERVAVVFSGGHYERATTENVLSTLESGGNTTLRAGNDALFKGAEITAALNLDIAASNVTITAVTDSALLDAFGNHGQGNYTHVRTTDETVRGSDLTAGNNLTINARRPSEYDDHTQSRSAPEEDESMDGRGRALSGTGADESMDGRGRAPSGTGAGDNGQTDAHQGNLTVEGSRITAANALSLSADQDIVIKEARERHESLSEKRDGKKGLIRTHSSYDRTEEYIDFAQGSALSGNIVNVQSNNDLTLQGSQLNAQGALALSAGQDIAIISAEDTRRASNISQSYRGPSSAGKVLGINTSLGGAINEGSALLTEKVTTQRAEHTSTQAVGSGIAAGRIETHSARDTRIQGSTLVADADIGLHAERNLNITSAQDTQTDRSHSDSSTKGFVGSWWQPTIGGVKQGDASQGDSVSQLSSQIASLGTAGSGNVRLKAGDQYTQTASQVLSSQGDIDIHAKDVLIHQAYTTHTTTQDNHAGKTALGGSISIPLVDAIKGIAAMKKAASNTSDSRMQALALVNAALIAKNAIAALTATTAFGGIKISATLGTDKNESTSTQTGSGAVGSTLTAGGDLKINATGVGLDANLTVIGSTLTADQDVVLSADNITLLAADNTDTLQSTNSASGASIGIGLTFGGAQAGFTIDFAANQARGNADGTDTTYTHTTVQAGHTTRLHSTGDTLLQGAIVTGDTVKADIGGNFYLASLQDISTYDSQQTSTGVSLSLCIPPICYGVSTLGVSTSNAQVQGDYRSVTQQSGIQTGDGGFQIAVQGNTDLHGAVITSTQAAIDANKNFLTTATLSTHDIQNQDAYNADSDSLSVSASTQLGDQSSAHTQAQRDAVATPTTPGASAGLGTAEGYQHSITRSGISAARITLTDEAQQQARTGLDTATTLANLHRDVTTGNTTPNPLNKTWDGQQLQQDVQTQAQITQVFSKEAPKAIAQYANQQADKLRKQGNDTEAQHWDEGGRYRIALHTLSGALGGGTPGAVSAGTIASTAPLLNAFQAQAQTALEQQGLSPATAQTLAQALGQLTATGIGAALGGSQGAATALTVDTNNRQLDEKEIDRIKTLAKQRAARTQDKEGALSENDALARLAAQALRQVDETFVQDHPGQDSVARDYLMANSGFFYDERGMPTKMFTPATKEDWANPNLYSETITKYPQLYSAAQRQETFVAPKGWSAVKELSVGTGKGFANLPTDILNIGVTIGEGYYNLVRLPFTDHQRLPRVPNLMDYKTPGEQVAGFLGPVALAPLPIVGPIVESGWFSRTGKVVQVPLTEVRQAEIGNLWNTSAYSAGGVANTEAHATRRAYLNENFGRTGDISLDINIRGNQEVASGFFRGQGLSEADANALMSGIDFTRPVNVQTLGSRKSLWQYQPPGAPQGNWYSLSPSVTPSELGINPYGVNRAAQSVELKTLNQYSTAQPVSVLRSTSAPVSDYWSVPGQQYPAIGGARQLFSTQKPLFIPVQH